MTTPVRSDRLLRFGEFELDQDAGELRRNGTRVSLPEQPFRLLTVLIERPGTTATRAELRERLWGTDTFVDFEHGLNAAVKRLRDALGDSAEQPRYIETVPKRGYKFIAALDGVVSVPTEPEAAPAASSERRRLRLGAGIAVAIVVVGLVAVAFWLVRPAASVPPVSSVTRNERRLTRGDGLQANPAWSPDGRMIAYASAAAGTWDIWIQPVAGGPALQVTKLPGAELNPSWSPDGSTIVFDASDADGNEGIFTAPVLGGAPARVTTFGAKPQWSPDGREILFGAHGGGNNVQQRLYLVGTDGRPPRPVLEREISSLDDVWSWCWQGDSRRVSVIAARPGHPPGLFTLPLEGGAPVETRIPADVRVNVLESAWAPDGRSVYVAGWRTDGTTDVWRFSLDARSLQVQRAERLKAGGASVLGPAISPDGTRLAFALPISSTRLWNVPLKGTTAALGDGTPVTEPDAEAGHADLAADGRSLAYSVLYPGSSTTEVRVRDITSGASRTVASDGHNRASLQWSRDGQLLAYGIFLRTGDDSETRETAIAVRRLSSNEERIITTRRLFRALHAFAMPTDWSPKGDAVLATSDYLSPHFSLALFPVDAAPSAEKAATVVVSDPDYNAWQGNYSPNGRWLAFVAQSLLNGRTTVEIVSSAGGPARDWLHVTTSGEADKPRWSPDGRRLYYTRRGSAGYDVWSVPFDPERGRLTGAASQVTRFTNPDHLVSPDLGYAEPSIARTFMILPIMERRGSIWMLDGVDR